MDVSSELIHSLLPVFLVTSLGASVTALGLIEGVAESTALVVKVFSGTLSDRFGNRKWLAALGYGLGALSKPAFALATSVPWVLAARFTDRVGKGLRGAPRDALVADITPPELLGRAYGLRQALDSVGAFLGPLAALGLMVAFAGDFRRVFWVAVIPAALAVLLLVVGVREPERARAERPSPVPLRREALSALGRRYWGVVALGALFTLARLSEAFLVLRARELGLAAAHVPLVLVGMNAVYAAAAYPAGRLADSMDPRALLAAGLAALAAGHGCLAAAGGLGLVALGVGLYGAHLALTQGLFAALVADAAPMDLRGTAFGFFHLASGAAMLAAAAGAGLLWDHFGAATAFWAGSGLAAGALVYLAAAHAGR